MSIASQSTQQKFPFGFDDVFAGVIEVIPETGMKLKSQDKVIGRITASTGMSVFSWGENLIIVVEAVADQVTLVGIESALKFGANLAGAHRHQKNFNALIEKLSIHLQRQQVRRERTANGDTVASADLQRPEGMSIGEWREGLMAKYQIVEQGAGYLWNGENFPSFNHVVEALSGN